MRAKWKIGNVNVFFFSEKKHQVLFIRSGAQVFSGLVGKQVGIYTGKKVIFVMCKRTMLGFRLRDFVFF